MLDNSTACCIVAAADLCLGSCNSDAGNTVTICKAAGSYTIGITCKSSAVIILVCTGRRDGNTPPGNGSRIICTCFISIQIGISGSSPYQIPDVIRTYCRTGYRCRIRDRISTVIRFGRRSCHGIIYRTVKCRTSVCKKLLRRAII